MTWSLALCDGGPWNGRTIVAPPGKLSLRVAPSSSEPQSHHHHYTLLEAPAGWRWVYAGRERGLLAAWVVYS